MSCLTIFLYRHCSAVTLPVTHVYQTRLFPLLLSSLILFPKSWKWLTAILLYLRIQHRNCRINRECFHQPNGWPSITFCIAKYLVDQCYNYNKKMFLLSIHCFHVGKQTVQKFSIWVWHVCSILSVHVFHKACINRIKITWLMSFMK